MEDMIAIELAVIIVAMFAIAVGFDCIKDGMCDIGAVIHDIITAPVRHYRQKKLMEQMKREWENYLEKNRAKMVRNLMKEQQRHFSASIGEKHTVEEWGKALEEFAEYQCQQDKEERTWQDHIMDRFMRRIRKDWRSFIRYQRKTDTESAWSLALKRIQRAGREKYRERHCFINGMKSNRL